LNLLLNYFFEKCGFHLFFFPLVHLLLCNYVLDRLVGVFNSLFSFLWFNFCVGTDLLVS
jgi:hypothetical protein